MKEIKKMIIKYLMHEYEELEATQQVCFAEIEKIEIIKIVYDNGIVEYVELQEGEVVTTKFKKL